MRHPVSRILAGCLPLLVSQPLLAAMTPENLAGVWMGVSHQTIQVTALRADGSFSGTYFTPAADVRARFSGRWKWEGEIFTMDYLEADAPPFRVPMKDENRLEEISSDKVILHTLPQGQSVEWNRVPFAPLASKGNPKPVEPPSLETLRSLTEENLIDTNALSAWMNSLIDASKKPLYDDKVVDALQNVIPKKAGYYFAIFWMEGMWSNGGMQQVLLRDEIEQTQYLLKLAADGYEYFGSPKTAALTREAAAKAIPWMKAIEALHRADAPEEKFQSIWSAVDAYDPVYDKLLAEEAKTYPALLADIHKQPDDYTILRR